MYSSTKGVSNTWKGHKMDAYHHAHSLLFLGPFLNLVWKSKGWVVGPQSGGSGYFSVNPGHP